MLLKNVAETAIVSFHALPVGFPLLTISKNSLYRLCSSGSSPTLTVRFLRRTPGRTPFHPCAVDDQLHGPIRFPQHLFSVHDHGRQRSGQGPQHFPPIRWPDCTLSRLRAEVYDRPVTQSIATTETSSRTITTLDRTLVVR